MDSTCDVSGSAPSELGRVALVSPPDREARRRALGVVSREGVEVAQERVERRGAHRHAVGDRDHPAKLAAFTAIETVFDDRRMFTIAQDRRH